MGVGEILKTIDVSDPGVGITFEDWMKMRNSFHTRDILGPVDAVDLLDYERGMNANGLNCQGLFDGDSTTNLFNLAGFLPFTGASLSEGSHSCQKSGGVLGFTSDVGNGSSLHSRASVMENDEEDETDTTVTGTGMGTSNINFGGRHDGFSNGGGISCHRGTKRESGKRISPRLVDSAVPLDFSGEMKLSRRSKNNGGSLNVKVMKFGITGEGGGGTTSGKKRIGRRRGPLRPEQRQQAHEIRKLRACLRCKFLKKTCDTSDPCSGCKPSHARLWQVPCTRIDIKDIGFFLKDWNADYERHLNNDGFTVTNIRDFGKTVRAVNISHGYGLEFSVDAREVFVHDPRCFHVDWIECEGQGNNGTTMLNMATGCGSSLSTSGSGSNSRSVSSSGTIPPLYSSTRRFRVVTARLTTGADSISASAVSAYLDAYLDTGFEPWVDGYFQGTPFITELLKTAYHHYRRSQHVALKKALKMLLAYSLTCHVTFVRDGPELGRIEDATSLWFESTCAPVMISIQVKKVLAGIWRELMGEVLSELSQLFSSVYSGEKLKHWSTIFMLASLLLVLWELIQFDCHFRMSDRAHVSRFCREMETIPVGVIVGLFVAISHQLPCFLEWDTHKHEHLFQSNALVCDTMTQVRSHVSKYEVYLRSRAHAQFTRDNFDCLSNKFISRLVIRSN